MTASAAAATGLKVGTPVVGGAVDTVAAAVGVGAINRGDRFLVAGTCARLCLTTEVAEFDHQFINCRHAFADRWLSIAAVNGAGLSLRWFRDAFSGDNSYVLLDSQAMLSPSGANGLIYLPYLVGESSPLWNPYARGVFFGIQLGMTQEAKFGIKFWRIFWNVSL